MNFAVIRSTPHKFLKCVAIALSLLHPLTAKAQTDVTPPTIQSVASVGGSYIGVCFSEPVQPESANDAFNYSVNAGAVQVTRATLRADGRSVVLALNSVLVGNFTLAVDSIRDLSGLSIANDTAVIGEVWAMGTDVMGPPPGVTAPPGTNFSCKPGDVDVIAGGTDIWHTSDEFHFVYQRRSGDFDVIVKLERLDLANEWSKAGLMARETLHGNSKTIQVFSVPLATITARAWGAYAAERRPAPGAATLNWDKALTPETSLPNAWMRLKRRGDIFTAYHGTDGFNWKRMAGPVLQPMSTELLVGMVTTSHNTNQTTVAQFRNFRDLRSGELDPSIIGLLALQDRLVANGGAVTFLAEVPGTSGYSVQWEKNGVDLPGATNVDYVIPTVTQSDAGTYAVSVRNEYGAVETSRATLTVTEAHVVLIPFSNVWRYEVSGRDLGTSWKEPTFNDSSWSSGPAPLGFETRPDLLPMPIQTPIVPNNQITYYFRSKFTVTNDLSDVYLTLTNLWDDYAVIHINGVEFLRYGMAGGVVGFNTPSYYVVSDAYLSGWERLPSSLLVRGENHIAVEMHQYTIGSSDMVFASELTANFLPPTELIITAEPENRVTEALKPAIFEVKVGGNRGRYQWFKDGLPIPAATRPVYTITNARPEHVGTYHVMVSNAVNVVRSRDVSLTVVADATPPLVVKADGTLAATTIEVRFSEPVSLLSATNRANYTITNTMGGTVTISQATLKNDSTVVLTTTARQAQRTYWLLVRNIQDLAVPTNTLAGRVVSISSLVQLFPAQTDWLYYDTIVDPPLVGTAWRQEGYDTADWYSLPAAFVLDSDDVTLPLPTRHVMTQGQITTYFRKQFNFAGGAVAHVRFRHYVDDGAVFYLNGVEILRYNMGAREITDQTLAVGTIGKAWPIETNLPPALLRTGTNLIAVELHGDDPFDKDLFFALELQAEVESSPTGPLLIAEQPQTQTGLEGQPITFRVVTAGAATLQWERNGQAIAGANQSTYTIPAVHPNMSGFRFGVLLSNSSGGTLRSQSATLTVQADQQPPQLVGASGQANLVDLKFSEPVNVASATLTTRYTLSESSGRTVQIIRAEIGQRPNEVILTTAELTGGVEHRIEVNGVTDQAAVANPLPAGSHATFIPPVFIPGLVKAEYYGEDYFTVEARESGALMGLDVHQLTSHPSFPHAPKFVSFKSSWELGRAYSQGDDYGARITGFFIPRETGPHIFYFSSDDRGELWLSSDAHPARKVLIAREPHWAPARQWTGTNASDGPDSAVIRPNRENISAPIQLVAGRKYYMETLVKEGGGGDCMAVAVQQPSDPGPPPNGSSPIPSSMLGGFWEMPTITPRITITAQPKAQIGEQGRQLILHVRAHTTLSELKGNSTVYYQWQKNGVDIAGAISPIYIIPSLTAGDNGAEYRAILRSPEGNVVVSETAVIGTVSPNTPVMLHISRRSDGNAVIHWERSGYILQRAETRPGIWEPAPTQVSPAVIPPSEPHEFFRLIRR